MLVYPRPGWVKAGPTPEWINSSSQGPLSIWGLLKGPSARLKRCSNILLLSVRCPCFVNNGVWTENPTASQPSPQQSELEENQVKCIKSPGACSPQNVVTELSVVMRYLTSIITTQRNLTGPFKANIYIRPKSYFLHPDMLINVRQ